MIRIGVNGATGRMGQMIMRLVAGDDALELAAAVERPGHPALGQDAGTACGGSAYGVTLTADLPAGVDVLLDFSSPAGTMGQLANCLKHSTAMVVGTTGFTPEQKAELDAAAETIPVMVSPNMSVGVNLVFDIAAQIAKRLGADYDIEIVEAHHRFKKDAPSGTALRIAERIADAIDVKLDEHASYGRHGQVGERPAGEIGIHAVRGGDIVGDHTVIFATQGERVELRHQAHSRETFVRGAIRAAKFIAGKPAGSYAMADVLATD